MKLEWIKTMQDIIETDGRGDYDEVTIRELEIAKYIAEIWMPHYDSYWYVTEKGKKALHEAQN